MPDVRYCSSHFEAFSLTQSSALESSVSVLTFRRKNSIGIEKKGEREKTLNLVKHKTCSLLSDMCVCA